MGETTSRAVRATVVGQVQGVGFRAYAAQEAQRLGLTGWVRNEPDGSVTAHVEGPEEAVGQMLTWLGSGPPSASVERADVVDADREGGSGFGVRW